MNKIELACGNSVKHGFAGLDIIPSPCVKYIVDLNKCKLPFKDNSVDEFYEQNSFYELEKPLEIIKECNRCLKVGGILEFQEMYFSSQYAYTPHTKNFWNFACVRLFSKGYRSIGDWEIISIDFEKSFLPPKWLVNLNRNFYEKYLSRIMPVNYIIFKLKKSEKTMERVKE